MRCGCCRPRAARFRISEAGRYGIVVGTTDQPTQITVLAGSAQFDGPGVALKVAANQTGTITGAETYQGNVGPAVRDAFIAARMAAEPSAPRRATSIPAQVRYLPGGQDLEGYGEWSQAPDYGEVWYPPVPATWVPYRDGQWAYVEPWGWTWVDRAPWGFAPSHYGRWAHIGQRWGWIPGEERARERSVYAPALVTFLGVSAGVAVGAAIANRSVGWVPLGPREAYHPWYHASQNYVRQVNGGHVRDVSTINNTVAVNSFANRAAATSVPASVMIGLAPGARGGPADFSPDVRGGATGGRAAADPPLCRDAWRDPGGGPSLGSTAGRGSDSGAAARAWSGGACPGRCSGGRPAASTGVARSAR